MQWTTTLSRAKVDAIAAQVESERLLERNRILE